MRKILFLLFPVFLFSYASFSDAGSWLGTSYYYGSWAIYQNPALLSSRLNPRFSLSFPSGFLGFTNNTFTISRWNGYIAIGERNDSLTASDKEDILSSMPMRGFTLHTGATFTPLSFSYRGFGAGIRFVTGNYTHLPKDVWRLALYGNELPRIYDLNNGDASAISYIDTRIGTGFGIDLDPVRKMLFGFSLSYIHGTAFAEVLDFRAILNSGTRAISGYDTIKVRFSYSGTSDSTGYTPGFTAAGSGLSFDFGTGFNYKNNIAIGLSFRNLLSFVNWTKNAKEAYIYTRLDRLNLVRLIDTIMRDSIAFDTIDIYDKNFSAGLPVIMNLGFVYTSSGKPYKIFLDYEQGFSYSALASKVPKFSLAGEYPILSWLPLRLGFTLGGYQGISISYGIGLSLGWFYFDFGYANHRGLFTLGKGEVFSVYTGLRTPMKGNLRGTIQDSVTGVPLIAEVTIQKLKGAKTVLSSDEKGVFSISLDPGEYTASASRAGYFDRKAPAKIEPNKTTYVKILLPPKHGTLVLKIKDKLTNEPVPAKATIQLKETQKTIQADDTGILKIKLEEGDYTFIFEHPDYYKRTDIIPMKRAQTIEKEILMTPNKGIVIGNVYNAQTVEPLSADIVIKDSIGNVVKEIKSKNDGNYESGILFAGTYLFDVKVQGYIPQAAYVFVKGGEKTKKDFAMLKEKMVFTFRNIYFDFNRATIRPESYPVLDSIAQVLKDNPTMIVEIGGHADERGTRKYNLKLTEARANSVRTYLITNHRIEPVRLLAVGYGEDVPVIPNAKTEDQHQMNRRVEFKILGEKR